ncbi:MAG: hypothetical protein J6T57_03035 [Alphaproteobacteria bacterium]|nr:hypothetical protein [Alphaproteobacteria bacterium]
MEKTQNIHVITEQISVDPLDSRLNLCTRETATYQLEIYHTDKSPNKNVGAIATYNGKFSYNIGASVNVLARYVEQGTLLTNIIENQYLNIQRGC